MLKINLSKRLYLSRHPIFVLLLSMIALILCAVMWFTKDSRSFQRFSDDFFVQELTANTLNMHYTIANPLSYDIRDYKAILPVYSKFRQDASKLQLEEAVSRLKGINSNRLNKEDAYSLRLLLYYLTNQQAGNDYIYYSNPFSPSSGTQSQLPILLAEYTFRNKQDISDYLALLDQSDEYFAGLTIYLKEQAKQGLFMADYSVDKVIEQCDAIMDEQLLDSGTHFLNTTFEERLNLLLDSKIITQEEKEAFVSSNHRLLTTVMLPAYRQLADELTLLKGNGQNELGLAHYPKGKEYYLYLLKSTTGSDQSIDDIKQMLFNDFTGHMDALIQLAKRNSNMLSVESEPEFVFQTPADMLKSLQQMISEDFPPLNHLTDGPLPVCSVKSISDNLEDYCSPAFYLTPPLDDIHNNVIYINQKNNPAGVDLYTTLAHEGYPGHLYQTVYSQLFMQKEEIHPVRSLLSWGGYVEGWAMYVELISFDYAKDLMKESGTSALYDFYKINRQIQLSLYSLLDIAIHYEGADYEQVHTILSSIGITNRNTTKDIFEYIVEEPSTYPKYYLGYLEILRLKEAAENLWGADYSDYRFHRFYLENGPSDFGSLHEQLKITSKTSGKS